MNRNVAVLVGSLRKDSFNRKLARAAIELAPASLKLEIQEIGHLPFYNHDLDVEPLPAPWAEIRQRIRAVQAVLFVTPEYNRSVPGVLKNAIDVASRPKETGALRGKPAAVISVSTGAIGGFGANHHLRQSLVFLNMPALPEEAYIGQAATLFVEQGKLSWPESREFVGKFLAAFDRWIDHSS
jgi:chromate reductase